MIGLATAHTPARADARIRPEVRGKFIFRGGEKVFVKGATYGTFRPDEDGCDYPPPEVVDSDFAAMRANGFNAVRTYTVPPRWLLDVAETQGLLVMVGLPWEQHVTFLDDRRRAADIERRVAEGVRACAGHPALLCFAVGNEIPASIVRWHGRRKIERFIKRLYDAAKREDPDALVTYVNFPSTEYLRLPFLDFVTFNVYLEAERTLDAYLARLQNLAGDRPLVMAEIGLDSRRNGEEAQARTLGWQIRTVFGAGAAGAFLFAWTDEWHRGGYDIEDWDFGLTARDRSPKPALATVGDAFERVPFEEPPDGWPRVSVVICTRNGAATLASCLDAVVQLDYPDYEVIVVCDGCTDRSAEIAGRYSVRLIQTPHRGLGAARNTGLAAATGEIVAYCDDDACPDPHWLTYVAHAFITSDHVAIGGPNIAPPGDGPIADCVANAPGGPIHVLIDDRLAEHIPGCNSSFRRSALEVIGGWDPRFQAAGDDVDVCWRLQELGLTVGFSPAAVVWHHRRNSVRAFWRQQKGYGRAEALLEDKWPERYNRLGHLRWSGRMYGKGLAEPLPVSRARVYQGRFGLGLFQRLYEPGPGGFASLPLMPEWYLLAAALGGVAALGLAWRPLLLALPLMLLAITVTMAQAVMGSAHASFTSRPGSRRERLALRCLTAFLHLIQPLARLWGRLAHGLRPWRLRAPTRLARPGPRTLVRWDESWCATDARLADLEWELLGAGAVTRQGGDFDRWDLDARVSVMGSVRMRLAVEEHGGGRQLLRLRCWPRLSKIGGLLTGTVALLALGAELNGATLTALALAGVALVLVLRLVIEWSTAAWAVRRAFEGRSPVRVPVAGPSPTTSAAPLAADERAG